MPTLIYYYVADIVVDGKHVELALWDMGDDETMDRYRPLAYPDSHVILICFYISTPDSLDNVQEKVRSKLLNTSELIFIFRLSQWIGEVNHFCQGLPIILVGLKKDLRRDPKTIDKLRETGQHPVTVEEVS
jgi:Ras family protein A